ncbi:hypothetical protein BH10ACI4_BH10ACI4_35590 [soil metagenome]
MMTIFCATRFSSKRRPCFSLNIVLFSLMLFMVTIAHAQSTFGAFVGTVRDGVSLAITGAEVQLISLDNGAVRKVMTNGDGQYSFQNVEPGKYKISMASPGFQTTDNPGLTLLSRETQRVDGMLKVGQADQTVEVQTAAAVINTDTSNLSETRTGIELNTLPLAVSSRAGGSTSPYATLTSQAGVQTDASGNISVAGAKPSLLSVTVDGISTMNVRSSIPATELFPSFNAIQEIRISQNANAAEFGGISDITTVSRGGNNKGHGGLFDNYETAGFNSKDSFATRKPKIVMNDFGLFYGGPVFVPHLYNGHNRSFYFLSYEGLRLPQQTAVTQSVPTLAMRSGNLSAYATQVKNAAGVPYAGNQITNSDISSVSKNLLDRYVPLPNFGAAGAIINNYQQNFSTPITSDQGDARIDQTITSKQSFFVRYSYKQRAVSTAHSASAGSALIGTFNRPEKDTSVSGAYNYILTPSLFNEFRSGMSKFINETSFNDNSTAFQSLGITGIPDLISPTVAASPNVVITGFTSIGGTGSAKNSSNTYQFIDNLTWTKGKHTMKTGVDFRRMYAFAGNVFGSSRLGRYTFNSTNVVGKTIGVPFAGFLLGVPDTVTVSDVLLPDMNGRGNAYAFYAQDDWKITNSLTLNFGLRYEYHPMLRDKFENSAQFLPDYTSSVARVTVKGAVVLPTQYGITNNVLPAFRAAIAPTPILTADQAGITSALVSVARTDFSPRIGFAWRPYHNDKMVLRGGYGRFIAGALGGSVVGGWAVSASSVSTTANSYVGTTPVVRFPAPFGSSGGPAVGSLDFNYAVSPTYRDPIVQQWNLTVEQDIGFNTGVRMSYAGSHGNNLALRVDLNQPQFGTVVPTKSQLAFPQWNTISDVVNLAESNYHSGTVEVSHRMTRGLQFQSSYTMARNLSNEAGYNPTANAGETGGAPSDRFHPGLDYGNVIYTRRHRYMASFLYQLPFGRNQIFLGSSNFFVEKLVSNWNMSGYFLAQSGPFLTPINSATDPTGTGTIARAFTSSSRPDTVPGASPYLTNAGARGLLNRAAFTIPGANIGRQGTAGVGSVIGRGTNTFSMSLMKGVTFTEAVKVEMGAQVQNLFNRHNFDIPNSLDVNVASFGQITTMQSKDNAGPRAVALTARVSF